MPSYKTEYKWNLYQLITPSRHWMSYFTFRCLSFLICQMEHLTRESPRLFSTMKVFGLWEDFLDKTHEAPGRSPATPPVLITPVPPATLAVSQFLIRPLPTSGLFSQHPLCLEQSSFPLLSTSVRPSHPSAPFSLPPSSCSWPHEPLV